MTQRDIKMDLEHNTYFKAALKRYLRTNRGKRVSKYYQARRSTILAHNHAGATKLSVPGWVSGLWNNLTGRRKLTHDDIVEINNLIIEQFTNAIELVGDSMERMEDLVEDKDYGLGAIHGEIDLEKLKLTRGLHKTAPDIAALYPELGNVINAAMVPLFESLAPDIIEMQKKFEALIDLYMSLGQTLAEQRRFFQKNGVDYLIDHERELGEYVGAA